jgi:glycosyltransferase involved in cell wall biosynthesis
MAKIALIYDKFLVNGGGERVFGILLECFPDAEVFALNAYPKSYWESKFQRRIRTPFLGFIFRSRFLVIFLYPFASYLMSTLRIDADVAFVYSSTCGKYVQLNAKKRILYSNYPNRGLYETKKIVKNQTIEFLITPFVRLMRSWETAQFAKFDKILSISETSKDALLKFCAVDSEILRCPYDRDAINNKSNKVILESNPPFFLLISRLEPEKDLTHVIEAFNNTDFRLKVIGDGSDFKFLQNKSKNNNIEFLGFVKDDELVTQILKCSAVIFPSEIEYSLVPIEANSLGKPVVSFDSSAAREILIDIKLDKEYGTAIFYSEKTSDSLLAALDYFKKCKWDKDCLIKNSIRFGPDLFKSTISSIVNSV